MTNITTLHKPPIELLDDDGVFIAYACMDCGRPVYDWSADDDLWTTVMGPWNAGHICADDFMQRAYGMDLHVTIIQMVL